MAKRKKAEIDIETESKPKKRKKHRLRKLFFLTIVGGGVSLVASPGLRSKVLDKLFGAENEFQYSPPPVTPTGPSGDDTPAAA